jgi:hypothetical protein
MKKTTMAILTIASVAGVATLANAVPFGPNDLPQSGGLNISQTAQGGGGGGTISNLGSSIGPTIVSTVSPNFVAVPEGSSLLLLGAGFLALALWHRQIGQRLAD